MLIDRPDDDEMPLVERESTRARWLERLPSLGIAEALLPDERAALEAPLGGLSDSQVQHIEGAALAVPVLLWVLGRLAAPPAPDALPMETWPLMTEHGLLEPHVRRVLDGGGLEDGSLSLRTESSVRARLTSILLEHHTHAGAAPKVGFLGRGRAAYDTWQATQHIRAYYGATLRWVLVETAAWDDDFEAVVTEL